MTERLKYVKSRIAHINTEKAKLDEILEAGRLARLKTGLGYVGDKHNTNVVNKTSNLGVSRMTNLTNAKKKKLINKYMPKMPPIVCTYYMLIGHVRHECN